MNALIATMLVVVFFDGARTLLECIYFGAMNSSTAGWLPQDFYDVLSQPHMILYPKIVNLVSALIIIGVLIYRWFPQLTEEIQRQQRVEELYNELQEAHEELQRTQDSRNALTHMIVHDMRTPLTSVITGLQTVQMVMDEPELARELTDSALMGANQLLLMVNDLLDIGKMEEGEMTLNQEDVEPEVIVQKAFALVEALVRERNIELISDSTFLESADYEVHVDKELTRRVLVNLIGNAIKYTPDGGKITVQTSLSEEQMLTISVIDNGPGIAPAHQKRIFDKFYQIESGANRRRNATGLGLTFCKMAVEAMGGKIGVSSEVGKGSRFWFTVPRVISEQSPTEHLMEKELELFPD